MNFIQWLFGKGFQTKGEETKGEETKGKDKVEEILDNIAKAKTFDELSAIYQSTKEVRGTGLVLGVAMMVSATNIRFENLEKRVSKLETEVYRGKPIV